jgi:hypothetical protein
MTDLDAAVCLLLFLAGALAGGAFVAAFAHADLKDIRRRLREMYPGDGW